MDKLTTRDSLINDVMFGLMLVIHTLAVIGLVLFMIVTLGSLSVNFLKAPEILTWLTIPQIMVYGLIMYIALTVLTNGLTFQITVSMYKRLFKDYYLKYRKPIDSTVAKKTV